MGRGKLTNSEIAQLRKNPYVQEVNETRVLYTDEFKELFVEKYFDGKRPTEIFSDAGFDVGVLGSKRIERASARWREANASGNLGEKRTENKFYRRNANKYSLLNDKVKGQAQEIERLNARITELEAMLGKEIKNK